MMGSKVIVCAPSNLGLCTNADVKALRVESAARLAGRRTADCYWGNRR